MTREFESLPPVSEAPVSWQVRAMIVTWSSVVGLLAGAVAFVVAGSLAQVVVPLMSGITRDLAVASGGEQPAEPAGLPSWAYLVSGGVVGVWVAVMVGARIFAKHLDAAKLDVHVAMYRDVIEAHMRSEARAVSRLGSRRPRIRLRHLRVVRSADGDGADSR